MEDIRTIEGVLLAEKHTFAIVATRFNDFIVNNLITGSIDALIRHGAAKENITLIRVPGAFELPIVCQKAARSKKYDAVIALGAVIRGATPHFGYVCSEATKGLAQTMLQEGIPIGFGLLTCDTIDQAIARAGSKSGNKGVEATLAVLELLHVLDQL